MGSNVIYLGNRHFNFLGSHFCRLGIIWLPKKIAICAIPSVTEILKFGVSFADHAQWEIITESLLLDIFLESVLVADLESKISVQNINNRIFGSLSKLKLWEFLRKILQGRDLNAVVFKLCAAALRGAVRNSKGAAIFLVNPKYSSLSIEIWLIMKESFDGVSPN
jgi:hypothetical protein